MSPIDAWAMARIADVKERELEHSLRVGPDKPLGGQGYHSLWAVLRVFWRERRALSRAQILYGRVADWIWIYAYHRDALEALLWEHRELLAAHDWPAAPTRFVEHSRNHVAAPMTPLYNLVADAYGDKLNPLRTDVLPDVSRNELFQALMRRVIDTRDVAYVDPATVYLHDLYSED